MFWEKTTRTFSKQSDLVLFPINKIAIARLRLTEQTKYQNYVVESGKQQKQTNNNKSATITTTPPPTVTKPGFWRDTWRLRITKIRTHDFAIYNILPDLEATGA